jgi:hypothetical protein
MLPSMRLPRRSFAQGLASLLAMTFIFFEWLLTPAVIARTTTIAIISKPKCAYKKIAYMPHVIIFAGYRQ